MAIEFMTIDTLKQKIIRRSMLLQVPYLFDLMGINKAYTSDQVLSFNLEKAIQEFEYYNPLIRHFNSNLQWDSEGQYQFCNNFSGFLRGLVPEKYIELIPNSIIGFTKGPNYIPNTYIREFNYDRPTLKNYGLAAGVYLVKGIYNRPFVINFDSAMNITSDSAIYYMANHDTVDTLRFTDQVMMTILDYLLQMKNNMTLPNMPVDLFQGVEAAYAKLEEVVKDYYLNTLQRGQLLV